METVLNLDETEPSRLDMARALLTRKTPRERAWPALLAALAFALSGLLLAWTAITAQPIVYQPPGFEPVPEVGGDAPPGSPAA